MKLRMLISLISLLLTGAMASPQAETVSDGALGITVSARTKGIPFSADVIRNEDVKFDDGREIHFEIYGKMYRDSQGRTRTDRQRVINGKARSEPSMIVDPVQQLIITLEHYSKTAIIQHPVNSVAATKVKSPSESLPTAVPAPAQTGKINSEPLGTMTLEGFTLKGTRYIRSKQPLDQTESWVSDDLGGMVLLMKTEGPQPGSVITVKLTNIRRGEPDPQVFQVPPGYSIKDTGIDPAFQKHP